MVIIYTFIKSLNDIYVHAHKTEIEYQVKLLNINNPVRGTLILCSS